MSLTNSLRKKSKNATTVADNNLANMPKKWNVSNNINYQKMNELTSQYANRGPFSYDINKDAVYDQYKNNFIKQGQKAMRETIGQLNARNGGYGSSYAEAVGQQQYQENLDSLNNIIPSLYEAAYNRYQDEGNRLLNAANAYGTLYGVDADAYNTNLNRWSALQGILEGRADSANANYLTQYNADRDFRLSKNTDKRNFKRQKVLDDRNYNLQLSEFKHRKSQDTFDNAIKLAEAAAEKSKKGKDTSYSLTGKTMEDGTKIYKGSDGNFYERSGSSFYKINNSALKGTGFSNKTTNVQQVVNYVLHRQDNDKDNASVESMITDAVDLYGLELTDKQIKKILNQLK